MRARRPAKARRARQARPAPRKDSASWYLVEAVAGRARQAPIPLMIWSPNAEVLTSVAPGIWRARSYVTRLLLIAFSRPDTISFPTSFQPMYPNILTPAGV